MSYKPMNPEYDHDQTKYSSEPRTGQGFAEQQERVAEAGRKGQGAIQGNMRHDAGRAVEAGHRSNQQRPASGDHGRGRARS